MNDEFLGLLKAAIRDPDPVVFLENEIMYGIPFEVNEAVMNKDYLIPFGKAKIMRPGKDITITAFSKAIETALKGAELLAQQGMN